MHRRSERWRRGAVLAALVVACTMPATAQESVESPEIMRAYDLETAGKYREAALLFRTALRASPTATALLGLERVFAELRQSDSLLPTLEALIVQRPRDPLYRTVQLRTLQILRRDEALRAAFERWVLDVPRDPAPYREYARVLIALGRPVLADSIVQRSRDALGTAHDLSMETAQLRAAQGQWEASAVAWRRALSEQPYLASAAAHALAPTPVGTRDAVRRVLLAGRALGERRAVAELELGWGSPQDAWDALRIVPPDTAVASAWAEFGERALGEEQFAIARAALTASLAIRRTPELAIRAADAALQAGVPSDVALLLPLAEVAGDPERLVRDYLPLHVAALSALGRPSDASALVERYDRALTPGQRVRMSRALATAWVRTGDLARARAALGTAGDADSSEAAGWLALYEGRLGDARRLLRSSREPGPALASALGVVSRTRGDEGAALGAAFLALARGDSATAIARFVQASERHPEARSALLLAAARIHGARGDLSLIHI